VADNDGEAVRLKVGEQELVKAEELDIQNEGERKRLISEAM
jgi:hypothetical protein